MDKMEKLNFYKGKKIFITGHTGFKGSWLAQILLNAGATIYGYSLKPITSPNLFQILNLEKTINGEFSDIRDLESLHKAIQKFKPEIVFHLAAQPLVRESYINPVDTYSSNVMGTVNILEACRNVSSIKSILNVTTDKVYENKEWAWGYRENEHLCGYDPYSNSKSCSELITYSYQKSFYNTPNSPSISTARSGNVIGGGDFSEDRIVPDCVRAAISNKEIVVRNPFSTRPYQHVLECLSGYLLLAQKQYENKNFEGNYNFGPDDANCVSTGTLVDLFCKNWANTTWINQSDSGPHEANFLKLDCSKAKSVLQWNPNWGIEAAIINSIAWYKAYASRNDLTTTTNTQIEEYFS